MSQQPESRSYASAQSQAVSRLSGRASLGPAGPGGLPVPPVSGSLVGSAAAALEGRRAMLEVLLIEDNPGDAALLEAVLCPPAPVRLTWVCRLSEGLNQAAQRHFDVLLLDLSLPDSVGCQTIERAARAMPDMPIVVLTGVPDERAADMAIRHGAQDYLVKGGSDRSLILRSIRYAVERKAAEIALRRAHDDLETMVRERTAQLERAMDDLRTQAEQNRLADESRRRAEREVLQAAEREQRRIGRDLHDSIQGALAGIKLMIDALKQQVCLQRAEHGPAFDKIAKSLSKTIDQTRSLARSLCPVDLHGHGLLRALEQLADTTAGLFGVPCEFKCRHWADLDESVAAHLYYICHEAVNNCLKHARAEQIHITLDGHGQKLELRVEDDGVGMADDACTVGGMGMRTMAYRASAAGGELTVRKGRRRGTAVVVSLTLPK